MVSAVSNATQTPPAAAPPVRKSTQETRPAEPKPVTSSDSVQLSKAAQATLAALKEASETSVQTAQEASHGDTQARSLLAKEAATQSAAQ